MKMKRLQMKKAALSVLFTLLLSVAGVTNTFAQDQIAVLQHEGVTTTYYGGNVFVDAYNAAENGDMITLSAGNFNTCTIEKCITIHGAGAWQDEMVDEREQTVFLSNFTLSCGGTETEHLTMEGVRFPAIVNAANPYYAEFYRCSIPHIVTPYSILGDMSNCKFINCRIGTLEYSTYYFHNYNTHIDWISPSKNVYLLNSIVYNTSGLTKALNTEKNIIAYNSYIAYGEENLQSSDFYNCIISGRPNYVPQGTCSFYNCVMANNGYEGSLLENAFHRNCIEVDEISQVFENFTGDFNNELFIISDEISSIIQGNDGTEVGIYGGMYPYTERPVYMIMRHCTVGDRTTDDGHLSVDIEVVTEE